MITRRGLLAGILASGFAPASIASGVLMPVRRIITPLSIITTPTWNVTASDGNRFAVYIDGVYHGECGLEPVAVPAGALSRIIHFEQLGNGR